MTEGSREPSDVVRWDEELPEGWAETVTTWSWQKWELEKAHVGWFKEGACPRCDHLMAVYQRRGVISLTGEVRATCNCGKPHPDRPGDAKIKGCGPYADIARHP